MIPATVLLGCALLAVAMLAQHSGIMQRFAVLAATGRRSAKIMRSHGASDFSKERAARILARRMLAHALAAGALLVVVALPLIAAIALDPWTGVPTRAALTNPAARLTILAIGICLVVTRSVIIPRVRSPRPSPRHSPPPLRRRLQWH